MLYNEWEALEQACLSCQKCALADTRHNVVFGMGPRDAEVMCIGVRTFARKCEVCNKMGEKKHLQFRFTAVILKNVKWTQVDRG